MNITHFLLDFYPMTPEERSLLERALKLAEENNALLLGLRRYNRVSSGLRALYWVVIIGASFGAFYLIQPYIQNTLNQAQDSASQLRDLLK